MRWRADPPIVDPVPITRQRVAAFAAACLALTVVAVPLWTTSGDALPAPLRSIGGGLLAVTALTVPRAAYRAVLTLLDEAQLDPPGRRPPTRVDAGTTTFVCVALGLAGGAVGATGSPWGWLSAVVCAGLALSSARSVRW